MEMMIKDPRYNEIKREESREYQDRMSRDRSLPEIKNLNTIGKPSAPI